MNPLAFKLASAGAALLLAGALGGYWIARRIDPVTAGPASAPHERRILYWHDPMVPNARFDKPGKSPFMDMDLVPVYADEQPGAQVSVSPAVTQSLGIRLGTVEEITTAPNLSLVGSVAFDEQLLEVVQARVEGYVTRLHVKTELTRVRKAQPLADILAPAWLQAQQEYLALANAESPHAGSIREAARQRLHVLGLPEGTARQLDANGKVDPSTTIVAPIEGVITELKVREGAAFMPGAALFRINGLQQVWVNAQVPESQVSEVIAGSHATVHATAWPGVKFAGRIDALLPQVDSQTRTLPVRIVVDNPDFRLAPGMFVDVELRGQSTAPRLVVPSEAIIATGERNVVIVAREGGGFDVAEITAGVESDGTTTILAGLEAGQRIVLSGQFLIDSEASLRAAVSRLSTPGTDGSTP